MITLKSKYAFENRLTKKIENRGFNHEFNH